MRNECLMGREIWLGNGDGEMNSAAAKPVAHLGMDLNHSRHDDRALEGRARR